MSRLVALFFLASTCFFANTLFCYTKVDDIQDVNLRKIAKAVIPNSNDASFFSKITTLVADNEGIAKLEGVEIFTHLRKLSLKGNLIGHSEVLAKLKYLEVLDLSHNSIKRSSWTTQLNNLKHLNLSNNIIKYGFLFSHENLEELDISFNEIEQLNGLFKKHIHLKSINASNNPINELPNDFLIPFLENIDLSHTKISSLENLKLLKSLRYLNVSSCPNLKNVSTLFNETKYGISCALQNLESFEITEDFLDSESKNMLSKIKSGALNKSFTLNNTTIQPISAGQSNNQQKPESKVFVEIEK